MPHGANLQPTALSMTLLAAGVVLAAGTEYVRLSSETPAYVRRRFDDILCPPVVAADEVFADVWGKVTRARLRGRRLMQPAERC